MGPGAFLPFMWLIFPFFLEFPQAALRRLLDETRRAAPQGEINLGQDLNLCRGQRPTARNPGSSRTLSVKPGSTNPQEAYFPLQAGDTENRSVLASVVG